MGCWNGRPEVTPAQTIPIAIAIARLGVDAADGRIDSPSNIARALIGLGLRLVPREELQAYLTDDGIARAELAADAAEAVKFSDDK